MKKSEKQLCEKCKEEVEFLYANKGYLENINFYCAKCYRKLYKDDPEKWDIRKDLDLEE